MHAVGPLPARVFRSIASALFLVILLPGRSFAQPDLAIRELPGTDGAVTSIDRAGNTLYIAGTFNVVGRSSGGGLPVDATTGVPDPKFPRFSGAVNAAIPDGAGGWFVGGRFTFAEGEPRQSLAHVLADGSLAPWAPAVEGTDQFRRHWAVRALALRGDVLYVGGFFDSVNGQPRAGLAAIDARTGGVLPWRLDTDGEVRSLLVDGARMFVGGGFGTIGGVARRDLAAVDLQSGGIDRWDAQVHGAVLTLAVQGQTLYVGGTFDQVGGLDRNSIAAVDARTGQVLDWDAQLLPHSVYLGDGNWTYCFVQAIGVRGGAVYFGGYFDSVRGLRRASIAAVDARTGAPTSFAPDLEGRWSDPVVDAIALGAREIYVGGGFARVAGMDRSNAAALDPESGRPTVWNPRIAGPPPYWGEPGGALPQGAVAVVSADHDRVFVGGAITNAYDWQARRGLAAMDLPSGRVLPWAPTIEGLYPSTLRVRNHEVFVSGAFTRMDGEDRQNSAAVDAVTGAVLPWRRDNLFTLLVDDQRLYGGGNEAVSGKDYLAPIDPVTGNPVDWIDFIFGGVETMIGTGNTLYLGGGFGSIDGQVRPWYAAVDLSTGKLLPWAPQPVNDGQVWKHVYAMVKQGDAIFTSGKFASMGGAPRSELAAVDATRGDVLPWAPEPDDLVFALATNASGVWAGGRFQTIGGKKLANLALLDATTGAAAAFDAGLNGEVDAITTSEDGSVFVGGQFSRVRGLPLGGLVEIVPAGSAVIGVGPAPGPVIADASVLFSLPNPLRASGLVRFVLSHAGAVTLEVFDLDGRRVATPIDRASLAAGSHEVTLRAGGWAPGLYLARLAAGEQVVTRKFLVVR